jgi:hypothetical protein
VAVCTCSMAVCLSKCARSGKLLLTGRASRDVPYLLQCLKRCAVPPAVPQEMCHTSCSASRDVPYLLQSLKRCAVPPAVPCCAAPHFITFRTHVTDSRCLQSVFQSVDSVDNLVVLHCDRQSLVSPNSPARLTQIFCFCWLGSCGRRWCSAV